MFFFLSRIDAFGQPYSLNLNGQGIYRTKLGGLCSFFIYMAIFGFIVSRSIYMVYREEPRLYEIKQGIDLLAKELPRFNFKESGF
jgi:hypothetical protein